MTVLNWPPGLGYGYCPETGKQCFGCAGRCRIAEERRLRDRVMIEDRMRKAAAEEAAKKLMQPPAAEQMHITLLRQINGSLHAILSEIRDMKKPIPIAGNYEMKDGKVVGKPGRKTSVSQKIAQRKSKRVRVTKTVKGSQRP